MGGLTTVDHSARSMVVQRGMCSAVKSDCPRAVTTGSQMAVPMAPQTAECLDFQKVDYSETPKAASSE